MGQFNGRRSFNGRLELDRPSDLAPRYCYRVVLASKDAGRRRTGADASGKHEPPQVVWLTNELEYARLLAAWLNALTRGDRAWVEAWNRAAVAAHSQWVRLRA